MNENPYDSLFSRHYSLADTQNLGPPEVLVMATGRVSFQTADMCD